MKKGLVSGKSQVRELATTEGYRDLQNSTKHDICYGTKHLAYLNPNMKSSITGRLHRLTGDKNAVFKILIFRGPSFETEEPDYIHKSAGLLLLWGEADSRQTRLIGPVGQSTTLLSVVEDGNCFRSRRLDTSSVHLEICTIIRSEKREVIRAYMNSIRILEEVVGSIGERSIDQGFELRFVNQSSQ